MFSIFVDFTIYVVPLIIYGSRININAECGVPILNWLIGLFSIIGLTNLQKCFMYMVVNHCRASRFIYGVVTSGLTFILLISWLIYGNILFFSRKNDCIRKPDTRLISYIMLAYLYVGYI